MKIRDVLFGKPVCKRFQDPVLGELTATVRPGREHKWCAWDGERVFDRGTRPTRFWLGGDGLAPEPGLVAEAHRVIGALPEIAAMAAAELRKHAIATPMEDFHLETMVVWDDADEILELSFVPVRPSELREELRFEWPASGAAPFHRVRLHSPALPVRAEGI